MQDPHLKGKLWRHFREFISLEADRYEILKKLIEEAALEYNVLEIAGNRHIVVAPKPQKERYFRRPPVILVAHYDRAEGSPGANDNSAGVFILLETAINLKKDDVHNWLVIFTDKEELKTGEGIQAQGSYALASGFKTLKMENNKIFCFDACGAGDTLVISTTLEYLLKKEGVGDNRMREPMVELRDLALNTARYLGMKKVLLAPTPFSDDVGFFRAGLTAQTITMLPSAECMQLVSELRKNEDFADLLISAMPEKTGLNRSIPETWRNLNSPRDKYITLTPRHFRTLMRFADALCRG